MATPTLERLDGERASLVVWVERRFRGRLSLEDAEDLVADALLRLAGDPHLPVTPAQRDNYLRRALWRDALDELRRRHGREMQRWNVEIDQALDEVDPGAEPETALVDYEERVAARAAAERVLERLPRKDAAVLRLRFLDDASPEAIAAELRISRSQYSRRLAGASRRALDALVDAHSGDVCPQIRRLIEEAPARLLDRDQAGRRDVHLDECVHCRAFSLRVREAREALALLPLPAVGLLERLSTRFGGLLGRSGESLAALRDGHDAAAGACAGMAGAGTAFTAGLGAKVAIGCTGAAVAVMCAGPLGVVPRSERAPVKRPAVTAKKQRSKTAIATPSAVAGTAASPAATVTVSHPKAEQTGARRPVTARSAKPRRPSAAQEFGPEAAKPTTGLATASSSSPRAGEFSPPSPPPRASRPAPSGPSSSFGAEFAP